MSELLITISLLLVKLGLIFAVVLSLAAYMVLAERKILGRMQLRHGPNRVGPGGMLQPLADVIKLLTKEDLVPAKADRIMFLVAPGMASLTALLSFAVVPFSPPVTLFGREIPMVVCDLNIGLLYFLGLSSLAVYGIALGGWASNSKYALFGSIRGLAQLISYELSMGLAVVPVVLSAKSFSLTDIVVSQGDWPNLLRHPVAFLIFMISVMAESKRTPFDLPEGENEIVAGYHTEYSGMKFAFFYMAEYAHMVLVSSLVVILFFGGWLPPFPSVKALAFLHVVPGFVWYLVKIMFFLYLYVWIRATFPRYRFDSLIRLVWKWLIPLSLLNFLIVALVRFLL